MIIIKHHDGAGGADGFPVETAVKDRDMPHIADLLNQAHYNDTSRRIVERLDEVRYDGHVVTYSYAPECGSCGAFNVGMSTVHDDCYGQVCVACRSDLDEADDDDVDYEALQADLDELEATDPAVKAAADNYGRVVRGMVS